MEFIRLNYWKFLIRFGLNALGFGLLFILLDITARTKTRPEDLAEGRLLGAIVAIGIAVLFAIIYFWAAYWYFKQGKKLIDLVIALDIFDSGNYQAGIKYKTTSLFYTKYYLQAVVSGYPVTVHLNGSYGSSHTPSSLEFNFCVLKFNQPHEESLNFPLNWKGQPKGDISAGITSLLNKLKDKGYPACQNLLTLPE